MLAGGTITASPGRFDVSAARAAYRQALAADELSALDPALPARVSRVRLGPYRTLLDLPATSGTTLDTVLAPLDGTANSAAMLLDTPETYLDNGLTRLELHLALKSRRLARRTLAGSVPED